jgi:hypothetical protein
MIEIAAVGVDDCRIPLPGHGVEFDWRGLDKVRAR